MRQSASDNFLTWKRCKNGRNRHNVCPRHHCCDNVTMFSGPKNNCYYMTSIFVVDNLLRHRHLNIGCIFSGHWVSIPLSRCCCREADKLSRAKLWKLNSCRKAAGGTAATCGWRCCCCHLWSRIPTNRPLRHPPHVSHCLTVKPCCIRFFFVIINGFFYG